MGLGIEVSIPAVVSNSPLCQLRVPKHTVRLVGPVLGAAVIRSRADWDVLFHMNNLLFLIEPDEIERDFGVFHPEHPGLCL